MNTNFWTIGWRGVVVALGLQVSSGRATTPPPAASFHHEWGRVIPLDGEWEIAEGMNAQPPSAYSAKVPVPGLVTLARPEFREVGVESGLREAFWYRRTFKIDGALPPVCRLKISKAMFGTKVFLNGHEVGESPLSFTPLYFSVAPFLKGRGEENELVVRIGAHISSLPDTVVSGGDPERRRYPPGIYDRVELLLSDDPWVANVQVAPDLEHRRAGVAVEFAAQQVGGKELNLEAVIYEWKSGRRVGAEAIRSGPIAAGRGTTAMVSVSIADCKFWTPDEPNLYVLELTGGDYRYATRFGMRSFKVDPAFTNRALLNGEPCFIRGTNFSIHRFFEDDACGRLPWDETWVRRLVRRFTAMDMNGARFVIGPPPELWYDIADEEGLMVFDEFPIWYAYQPDVGDVSKEAADPYRKWGIWPKHLTAQELVGEYTAWMRERWNHPCVIVWDAQNETWAKQTGEAVEKVRGLDRSGRPWDNGWSPPVRPDDIREAHPYFERWVTGTEMATGKEIAAKPFTLDDLATAEKLPSTFYLPFQHHYGLPPDWHWTQPCVINEYSYLWLNRDGTPTLLTKPYYDKALGPTATAGQRRKLYARYLAAVTEYWRATRSCLGVLYPFGLTGSIADGATSDNLTDVAKLEFDPAYDRYVPDAFAAVGICAGLWQTEFALDPWRGAQAEFPVTVINDTGATLDDAFEISVMKGDTAVLTRSYRFAARPFEAARTWVKIDLPKTAGDYEVVATVRGRHGNEVRSHRLLRLHD